MAAKTSMNGASTNVADNSRVPFATLKGKVTDKTLKAIKDMGLDKMTEIQAKTIHTLLEGHNLVGAAKTGSGKTLAFLIPAVELIHRAKFNPRDGLGVVVLSPTRELAIQIFSVLEKLMKYHDYSIGLVMGGANKRVEAEKLRRGVNILISTPGRLLDHIKGTEGFVFNNLLCLIIDEADRLLDIGFERQMKQIFRLLPQERQVMLFSATLCVKTKDLITCPELALKETPMYIGVDEHQKNATVSGLKQGYVVAKSDNRFLLLYTYLKENRGKKIMVFFSSCKSVKFHAEVFNHMNVVVEALHGRQSQSKRTSIFAQFCQVHTGTLLCTDIAARGLDIPKVDLIIQFDPPSDPKEYIHRVGRTARGDNGTGDALLILRPEEIEFLNYLQKAKIPLQEYPLSLTDVDNIQMQLQHLVSKDKELELLAKKALISYLRSYNSHQYKDIFNPTSLDLSAAAKSFGFNSAPSGLKFPALKGKKAPRPSNPNKLSGDNKDSRDSRGARAPSKPQRRRRRPQAAAS